MRDMPEEEDVTAADRLIIESPTTIGLIVLRALAPEPGLMPMARRALAAAQCRVEPVAVKRCYLRSSRRRRGRRHAAKCGAAHDLVGRDLLLQLRRAALGLGRDRLPARRPPDARARNDSRRSAASANAAPRRWSGCSRRRAPSALTVPAGSRSATCACSSRAAGRDRATRRASRRTDPMRTMSLRMSSINLL